VYIGPYRLSSNVLLAPMAGVSDAPFRRLCRELGAGLAASEMVSADPQLQHSRKTRQRLRLDGDAPPCAVQIAGADPHRLAAAAQRAVDGGARIVDLNMGCPAKKVCNVYAGSALLRDERLVGRILDRVVRAVDVPVTLKVRTGWSPQRRNGVRVARIAAAAGVAAIAVHGRTRACGFGGEAEYRTIAAIKAAVRVPVIANGDIDSPLRAARVLRETGADGVMIGRAAQGNPWIFREIVQFLGSGCMPGPPAPGEVAEAVLGHVQALHRFYGDAAGVRIARKHLRRYLERLPGGRQLWADIRVIDDAKVQIDRLLAFFAHAWRWERAA